MNKLSFFKKISLVCLSLFFCVPGNTYASHILGGDLTYTHVAGTVDSYKITLVLYGDCGPSSLAAFVGLPVSTPQICIYNGATLDTSIYLSLPNPQCGVEVTPLCSGAISQCTSLSSPIIGLKKFVFSRTIWLSGTSSVWRFVYTSNNGSTGGTYSCGGSLSGTTSSAPSAAGRTASITNIVAGSLFQLIDTLNNTGGPNSSPVFTIPPPPFYRNMIVNNYYPDAVDPDGDSLTFSLANLTNGTGACGTVGGAVSYVGSLSGTNPFLLSGSLGFNTTNGLITFTPNAVQRAVVDYNIREFRSGVLVGTSQREMTFSVLADTAEFGVPCYGIPDPGTAAFGTGCGVPDTLKLSGEFPGCGLAFQWQYSTDGVTWTNISGATTCPYTYTPTGNYFYRCQVICTYSALSSYSNSVYVPLSSGGILHNTMSTPVDTFCNGPVLYITACGDSSSSYSVATSFGDGTFSSTALTPTPIWNATITHAYTTPGSYYIYEVLYSGTTPADTLGFTYEYTYCRSLPVKFYYDANSNCLFDGGDSYCYLPVLTEVDSNGIPVDTISATSGFYYRALGGPGTVYEFRIISAPAGLYESCPTSGILYDTISSTITDYPSLYFAFNCTGSTSFDLAEYATFRAGPHNGGATMIVNNSYCTPETATYTMTFSPKYTFVNAYPPPSSVTGNLITWNLDSVSAVKPPYVFNVSLWKAGTPDLTIGDTVHSDYLVTPTTGDVNTTNNSSSRIDTVQSAYDPNYLIVKPAGYIPAGTQLQYTIGFENTGNAMAHDVYILDTISDFIDISSLKVLASSAAMQEAPFINGANAVIKFDFPHINLPDSSHHNQNTGMVIFTVKTKTGLPDGTKIFSHAGIYFDDNLPVLTDTSEDIICSTGGALCALMVPGTVINQSIELFPNPATNRLTIKADNSAWHSFTITNTIGQTMDQMPISGTETTVNVASLPAGLYYITFSGGNGTKMMKFVKM